MKTPVSRRRFLQHSAAAGAAAFAARGFPAIAAAGSANGKVVVGVMGLGRGLAHVESYSKISDARIGFVCDVDAERAEKGADSVEKKTGQRPEVVKDFRRMLENKSMDAISIAAPNFWHTPAAVMAMSAGKHVYVEKPGSGTPHESELIVAAARKWKRHVQMGNQRRSMPYVIDAIAKVHGGDIGAVRFARCWYVSARASIGVGKVVPVPARLDYALWQGPVPERPYKDNLVHYNWHWMWHWGGGELQNNGPHYLDVARWGLGVDCPARVTCNGGRYTFQDDQQTPDTGVVEFDFGDKGLTWEWSSCHPRKPETFPLVQFYGDGGSLAIEGNGWKRYDLAGKLVESGKAPGGDLPHFTNFIDVIRGEAKKLNSEIGEVQKSSLLCHLGNVAYRSGRTLHLDSKTRRLVGDADAQKFWTREYRKGWEPKV
ncbi:MAG: Gfo/Idh/MocA family oxidoreductase [Verrucomicrobia bacterium]|nr:Gfo/Idh/MocA family oxidoreductase [Verrucomicrobiota bacterium]